MTTQEISSRFDYVLQRQKQGLILDEYQKSLLLTKAQSAFVTQILNTYEYTDAMRSILGPLIVEPTTAKSFDPYPGEPNMYLVTNLASDIKSVVYEEINENIMTIPMDWNDIHKSRKNPFREPYGKLAYRITGRLNDSDPSKNNFLIFTTLTPKTYRYVYCKVPSPIILEDLSRTPLEIQGENVTTTSVLPYDSIILVIEMATQMALQEASILNKQEKEPAKQ